MRFQTPNNNNLADHKILFPTVEKALGNVCGAISTTTVQGGGNENHIWVFEESTDLRQ